MEEVQRGHSEGARGMRCGCPGRALCRSRERASGGPYDHTLRRRIYPTIRLERPSESIRQIEFSEGRGRYGYDERSSSSIRVVAATYGKNCGAQYGNVTAQLASACDGRSVCEYTILTSVIGDPVYGCQKDYVAEWQCGSTPARGGVTAGPEAGSGSRVLLRCPIR